MSREHPLLMKGPLVVATLAGRKTQTRRLVTPANSTVGPDALQILGARSLAQAWSMLDHGRAEAKALMGADDQPKMAWIIPVKHRLLAIVVRPRVEVGDGFWIRETWRAGSEWDADAPSMIDRNADHQVLYMADGRASGPEPCYGWGKTRTAIHMPRWACRAVLPVTSVGAERLQDISEEDARAEGCEPIWGATKAPNPYSVAFAGLWDEINGKREGARWADNPMLWAFTYKLVGAP